MTAGALVGSLATVPGQAAEYNAPGVLGIDPGDDRERLNKAIDEARWRLGPVRIDPWIALREVAWIKPPEADGDLTVSIGAGLRGYLPIGSKAAFAAQIRPQYIWWKDRSEERRLGGTYGVGLFYFTDRAGVQLTATSSDLDDFVTDEVDRRAKVDSVSYRARVELPISSRLGVFVNAGRSDQDVEEILGSEGQLEDLSSKSDQLEGGLAWRVGSHLKVRAGAGRSETTFAETARNRDNDGDYWLAGLDFRRSKTGASVTYRDNDQRGTVGSEFEQFTQATWQARIHWTPGSNIGIALYGARELGYSVDADQVIFLQERLGVRLSFPVTRRISGSAFYEDGVRAYDEGIREDDVTSWGGQFTVPLGGRVQLLLGGRSTRTQAELESTTLNEYRAGLLFGSDHRGFF